MVMIMIPARLLTILAAMMTAGLVWYVAHAYPFNTHEKDSVSLAGAPPQYLKFTAGDTISQSFSPQQTPISAVSVYAANDRLTNQKLRISLTSPLGQELTAGHTVRPSYRDGQLKLTFPIPWLATELAHPLIVRLKHNGGDPLYLVATTENAYREGHLAYNNQPQPELDLSLTTSQPAPITPAAGRGVMSGLSVMLGALIIHLIPPKFKRTRWLAAGLLLLLITPLALGGFWQSRTMLGIDDWDYYFSVHEVLRRTVLTYHTLPFWNPYTCGGTAGWADPESPLLTPSFALELLFGVPLGLRLAIFLATATGAIGTLLLAKRLGLSVAASLIAAIAASFGSVNLLEIIEGHVNIFAAGWLPWIFWSWLGAYRIRRASLSPGVDGKTPGVSRRGGALLCGVFLALTFFQGGVYLLFYTTLAFVALIIMLKNHRSAFRITLTAGLWAACLAAVKLIPVLLWLQQFQDEAYAVSTNTLPYLHEIFLGRHPHGAEVLPDQGAGWHEYGAYIGPLVLSFGIISLVSYRRQRRIRLLTFIVLATTLLSAAGPALEPFFNTLPFIPRSTISRVIIFTVLAASLLAGHGIDQLIALLPRLRIIIPSLIGLVAVDLMSLAYPLSTQAFIVPRANVTIAPAAEPIAFTNRQYRTRLIGIDYPRTYLATLAGYGTLSYCTPLGPHPSVVTAGSEADASAVTATDPSRAAIKLHYWSPNRIHATADIFQPTDAVINTNYARGWKINGRPAQNIGGRVGLSLPIGQHNLTFRYRAPGFLPGLALSVAALLFAGRIGYRYFRFCTRQCG
ncbi:MAG: hypothetical protein HY372_02190 [Candidatus Andersenbacteria bacterium]|nr:hypothetical protein [Candidatus Andersenbacteria bacterium]